MVPYLLSRVLKYGPLGCIGFIRGPLQGPRLSDHVTTLGYFLVGVLGSGSLGFRVELQAFMVQM